MRDWLLFRLWRRIPLINTRADVAESRGSLLSLADRPSARAPLAHRLEAQMTGELAIGALSRTAAFTCRGNYGQSLDMQK